MKTKQDAAVTNILAALQAHQRAKVAAKDDHPMAERALEDLTGGAGILKSSDMIPAKTMAHEGEAGFEMELARTQARDEEKARKVNQQRQKQRAHAKRKMEIDEIANAPFKPGKHRMEDAWYVVHPLVPIINKIALSKQRWAARFLGSVADEIPQVATEKIALVLAKGDHDLAALRIAAEQLGGLMERTNQVPGDQVDDDERAERKRDRKNRKMLMGLVNNRVMGALVDIYTNENNLRWDSLDLITTVMANINGVGEDPMMNRFKADRAPAFLGTRFQTPGGIDPTLLAVAITGAITNLGLDPIVEILLDQDNRRVDGAVKWTKCAEPIFMATPGGQGPWMWDLVCKATEHLNKPQKGRADAARAHVRNLFEWMPLLIGKAVDAFDPHYIGWSPTGRRAVMASDFELFYCGDPNETRLVAEPALRFTTVEEAAKILAEAMETLTHEDYLDSVLNV